MNDSQEQTAGIFRSLARRSGKDRDLGKWHALQTWLATQPGEVEIPFAETLAELVPPIAVRLRRDFQTVLILIRAHALLHQASRRKDEEGRIIPEIVDYTVVRDLIADVIAEGVDATIKPEIREVVNAVAGLIADGKPEVRQSDLVGLLKLDKSSSCIEPRFFAQFRASSRPAVPARSRRTRAT